MSSTPSLTLLSGPLWSSIVVLVRVSSMGQIELFSLLLGIIIIIYLKPYNCSTMDSFTETPYCGSTSKNLHSSTLNENWRQHWTKQQLYSHLPPVSQAIQKRRARHSYHSWRCKDVLISNVVPWTLTHRHTNVGWPTKIYIHQLCADTGCRLEDLPGAMTYWDRWRERESRKYILLTLRQDDDEKQLNIVYNRCKQINTSYLHTI